MPGKGHTEPSRVLEIFYILILLGVLQVCTYVNIHQALNIKICGLPIIYVHLNTNKNVKIDASKLKMINLKAKLCRYI